jgi:hypothetical protein
MVARRSSALAQAREWFACARALFDRDRALWLGMAGLYLLFALVLRRIPFVGSLVVVLISPLLLAGALLAAHDLRARAGRPPAHWRQWLAQPLRTLLQALANEAVMYPALLACIVTLGLVLVATALEYLLTGGSLVSGLAAGQLAGPVRPWTFAAIVLVTGLYVVLGMALYFLIPLTVLGEHAVLAAVAASFRACARHAAALALFAIGFVVLAVALAVLFVLPGGAWLGYGLLFTAGLVALPLFVAGLYCSYRTLFDGAH